MEIFTVCLYVFATIGVVCLIGLCWLLTRPVNVEEVPYFFLEEVQRLRIRIEKVLAIVAPHNDVNSYTIKQILNGKRDE